MRFNWKKYLFEFITVFAGVTLAFTLNTCSENARNKRSEVKTLVEIRNGLVLDQQDISENQQGHELGIKSIAYFRKLINNDSVPTDSARMYYTLLLRDLISIQNVSGYETLKSKGLELIYNDSLRLEILSLYDFHYEILQKLEETYSEMQFNETYYRDINEMLAPYMQFDQAGQFIGFKNRIVLEETDKTKMLSYLWRIEVNRKYIIKYYELVDQQVDKVLGLIKEELTDD